MTGFQVPKCASCGHARSHHKSAGTHWPHAPSYGVCLRASCDCTEFIPLDPSSRKEPSHVQVQDDGDQHHPVRPAVAARVRGGVPAAVVLDLNPGRVSEPTDGSTVSTAHLIDGPLDGLTVPFEFVTKVLDLPDEPPGGFYMLAGRVAENTYRDFIYRWTEEQS